MLTSLLLSMSLTAVQAPAVETVMIPQQDAKRIPIRFSENDEKRIPIRFSEGEEKRIPIRF